MELDPLTHLPNRHQFLRLLEEALAAAPRENLTVLFIDLDRFRRINDTLGYAAGDELLRSVGVRLRSATNAGDVVGRVGGDGFAVVTSGQAAAYLELVRAPYRIGDDDVFVTASIGAAMFPNHGVSAVDLLHNADVAMRRSKEIGGDELSVFLPENTAADFEQLKLETALRRALASDQFSLVYQPVVDMNGDVDGLEALLTWSHPVYGQVSPRRFIPIAEETGLIVPIGAWVLRQACLQGARWHAMGCRKARISVNVSARQFERRDFVDIVADALEISGFPPERLELELTESSVLRNLLEPARRMDEIRELGVSIAIDDFGTGYSSLSYLSRLPVDTVKIDQSFLRRLLEPAGSLPVVQSIVRLAHAMRLEVVAEGVETLAELDLVRVLGCDKVQGHVYGPALRCEEAEELLARGNVLVMTAAQ